MIRQHMDWRLRRLDLLDMKETDFREVLPVRIGKGSLLCRLWIGPSDLIIEAFGEAREWVNQWQLPWAKKTKKVNGGFRVPAVLADDLVNFIVERMDGPYSEQTAALETALAHLRRLGWAHKEESASGTKPKPNLVPGEGIIGPDFHLSRAMKTKLYDGREAVREIPGLNDNLYDYQTKGASFLVHRTQALLADDMGLGKPTFGFVVHCVHLRNDWPVELGCMIFA